MQTVHIRVNDAATGQPTPCRVRICDSTGKYHAPLGRRSEFPDLSSFAEGNVHDASQAWAYIDGACEILLPPGLITVAIRKGIEYVPVETSVALLPGKLAMRFSLQRWIDCRAKGWFAGDGRVHGAAPHDVLLQAAGEDLAVVNLLAEESASGAMANIVAFSGQKPCLESPGHMVVVNTHNVDPHMGSLGLLNCHRVVYPLRLGHEGQAHWTLADWCDQCHRKQGLVVWTSAAVDGSRLLTEGLADLVLGKIDAFEVAAEQFRSTASQTDWYTLLDAGFRMPLLGSSGARGNGQLLGRPRTYCQLNMGETLTYKNWIEALRAGRTFVTEGPIIDFTVNGQTPGSVVELPGERPTAIVHAEVHSPLRFATLEVLCNGRLAGQASPKQEAFPWSAELNQEIEIPEGGWMIVNCWGPDLQLLARTSPVYVKSPSLALRVGMEVSAI